MADHFQNYMRLRVTRKGKTIGSVFQLINELQAQFAFEDYSISQTTLEQIFAGIAGLKPSRNSPIYVLDQVSGEPTLYQT